MLEKDHLRQVHLASRLLTLKGNITSQTQVQTNGHSKSSFNTIVALCFHFV